MAAVHHIAFVRGGGTTHKLKGQFTSYNNFIMIGIEVSNYNDSNFGRSDFKSSSRSKTSVLAFYFQYLGEHRS